jgi:hypothetical protein
MPQSPAQKRLARILNDTTEHYYGEKLVRVAKVNKAGERRVLELIDQNRAREARALILQLDKNRRASSRAKRYVKLTQAERTEHWPAHEEREFWDEYKELMAGQQ